MFSNILVVCVGNICRSPMAESLLRKALNDIDKKNCIVSSAGLNALVGKKPDSAACQLMQSKGIDISLHRACQLNKEMIRKSDLILVMESSHKTSIESEEPTAKGKVFRLGEWGKFDIPDPYKQDLKVFESTLKLIEQGVAQWIEKL
jgi:protein-tyrosine phosphatase